MSNRITTRKKLFKDQFLTTNEMVANCD